MVEEILEDREIRVMSEKLKVGILGGTGMVGQRFISLLENHPWFEVTTIAASPRSAGKTYEDAVGDRWKMDTPMPEAVKKIIVKNVNEVEEVASQVDFVFSAVDMSKDEIKKIEEDYAKTETPVVSNNSAHRWTPDVPMVVPEINPQHMEVIKYQKERLGTKRGFVAVKPNCSIQSYAPVLTAWKEFEPYEVVATTYQAISGAGKTFKDWPEMVGNIIPFIGGEEEKSEKEPLRLWGYVDDEKKQIVPAESPVITCQCIRVPVLNGHTAAVFVKFKRTLQRSSSLRHSRSSAEYHRSLGFQAHQSSSSDTVKRIIVLRLHLMWIMSMVWESMSDVSERIQSMTGSSSDFHTTQYVVQPVEQCFVQSFLRHRVTSQRSRFSNLLENIIMRADFPFVGCGHRYSTQ